MAKSMVEIVIDAKDQFSTVMGKANSRMKDISASARKAGLVMGALGGAGIFAGKNLIDAALEQEKALTTLGAVIGNTGESFASVREEIEAATAALESKTNFGDEQQIRALARMVPILGDVDKAMAALPLVLDAASASGLQVESVAGTLSRALGGMVNTSESIGVVFEENATFSERLAIGMNKVGGAAEANANPFTQLGNAVGTLKEKIGAELIPVVLPLIDHFKGLIERVQTLNPRLIRIVAIVGMAVTAFAALVAPFLLLIGFLPAMVAGFGMLAGAVTGLMAVFTVFISWPALIVAAFAALAIALIRNWGGVRDKVVAALDGILAGFSNMVNKAISGLNWLIGKWNDVGWGDPIRTIDAVSLTLKGLGDAGGDAFEFVADKIGGFTEEAANLMKGLPAKVVPSIDKIIAKFNEVTGENLPMMSDIIETVGAKAQSLFDSLQSPKAQQAVNEAAKAGDAAGDSWDKAKQAHEDYQKAMAEKTEKTTRASQTREQSMMEWGRYMQNVESERAGTAEAGALYNGLGQRIDGGGAWDRLMTQVTGRESDPFSGMPVTLSIDGEEVAGAFARVMGKAAEKMEANGGA